MVQSTKIIDGALSVQFSIKPWFLWVETQGKTNKYLDSYSIGMNWILHMHEKWILCTKNTHKHTAHTQINEPCMP